MSDRLEKVICGNLDACREDTCYWWQGSWHTRGELLKLVDECEKNLSRAGFTKGQRLVVMMKNSPMIPALALAVWRLGGIFCPLNVAAGLGPLCWTLDLLQPFAVVASPEIKTELIEEFTSRHWTCVISPLDGPLPAFERPKGDAMPEPESEDIAVIFSTSGTTGNPKAVPLTHENLLSNCEGTHGNVKGLAAGDVFLVVLPNFHSFGLTVANLLPLTINAKLAIVPAFMPPSEAMKAILEAKVNVLFGVPAMFSFLLGAVERGRFPKEGLSEQKYLVSGGDRLNPKLHELCMNLVGRDILEGYGLTETSPVVAMECGYDSYKPGTVGPFLKDYEYKLRTREGDDVAPGINDGVLWVRGPSVTKGYYHAPEITAERFDGDWFNTGDYVRIDEDGYVKILDRVTDIIIVGGFNVYPQEVEKVLSEHPAVHTAIVVGAPHKTNGEIVEAYIQRRDGFDLTERDLIKFAKGHLAHYKVPRKIEFVDEFPLSGTGKILRRILRERAGKRNL